MCGIFAYTGSKEPVDMCLKGLRLLEYRGYDSSGIAGVQNGTIFACRESGKIRNLENALDALAASVSIRNAIAHTRWATHGKPSKDNAHPQLDEKQHIAIVHNGIIENYLPLKRMLQERGIIFSSETDTEVVAQLVSFYYNGNILEAFHKAISHLQGFWAIALIHKDHPDTILASCRENPLAIGRNIHDNETYLASDVNAFFHSNLEVVFLQNGEIACLSPTSVEIFNEDNVPIERESIQIATSQEEISKNGFEHFMLKEIFEQPNIIRQTLQDRYDEELGTAVFPEMTLSKQELKDVKQILILACGTSWHAGLIAAQWIEEKAGIPAKAEIASEFRYRKSAIAENTLVIAISQSGETFDTIAAVREVQSKNIPVLAICNVPNSTLTRDADTCLFLRAGREVSVCSTKAFTGQITTLALFSLLLARLHGKMSIVEGRQFLQDLLALPAQADLVLRNKDAIQLLAKKYASFEHFFFLGRNHMYTACLEAALKLKEISYVHAMAYPAGEMKHGPIALVDPTLAVLGFCGHAGTIDKMLSNLMEIKARLAPLLVFAPKGLEEVSEIASDVLWLPKVSDDMNCFLYSIAAQLFAYYIALERGADIDQPRNLAKSVTVE